MSKKLFYVALILFLSICIKAQSQTDQLTVDLSANENSPKIIFAIKGGFSYLTVSTKDDKKSMESAGISSRDADNYLKDLKTGWHTRTNLSLQFRKGFEIGIMYRYFSTSTQLTTFIDPGDGIHLLFGELSETEYVNFVGATFSSYRKFNEKLSARVSYGLGYSMLRDETTTFNQPILATGNSFGLDLALEGTYMLGKKLSLAAQLGLFITNFRKVEVSDGNYSETVKLEKEQAINLSALDLSVGLTYRF